MVLPLRVAVAATEPSADITVPKTAKRSLALAQSACSPYEWRLAVRPPKRGLESVPSGDGRLFAKLHTIFMVGHTAGIPPIVFRCHTLKKWEMLTATYLAVSAGSHQSPDVNPHLYAAYHEVPCPPATVFTFARCSPTKSVDLESNRSISTNMSPLNVEPCACSLPDLPDRPLVVKCTPVAFAMRCRYCCDQGESAETSEPGDLAHDLPKNSEHF